MIVRLKDLQKLYAERKNDDDLLIHKGLEFVPGYLKYLIEYAEINVKEGRSDGNIDLIPTEAK